MNIKSFHIDGRNRIVVNGIKLMWVTLKEIRQYGNDSMTDQERFELFLEASKQEDEEKQYEEVIKQPENKKKTPKEVTEQPENIKINEQTENIETKELPKTKKGYLNGGAIRWGKDYKEKHKLDIETLLELLSDKIEEFTNFYYRKYKKYLSIDKEDIRQEIIIEVIELHKKFENNCWEGVRDKNINTFAYVLNQRLNNNLYSKLNGYTRTISISSSRINEIEKLRNTETKGENIFIKCTASYDELEELALEHNMPVARVEGYLKLYNTLVNVESNIDEISLDDTYSFEDSMLDTGLKETIQELLNMLTPRQKLIISLRFGLEDGRALTLAQIGKELNRSQEVIRQTEKKVIRKFRSPSIKNKLRDFL